MTTISQAVTVRSAREKAGLSLFGAAIASVAPFMLSLLIGLVFTGRAYSSPFSPDRTLHEYFAGDHTTVQFVALLQFGSALGLAVFTCLLRSRLRQLAPTASGATSVVSVGGVVASSFLALNALIQWVLSRPEVSAQPALVRALNYLFWSLGGPAHVAWLGLLLAGVSLVGLRLELLPRWFGIAGLVVTGLAELSLLTLLTKGAVAFIPLGRFPALVWLVAASLLLPRNRT